MRSILNYAWNILYFLYDTLVPRFITEDVAVIKEKDGSITVIAPSNTLYPDEYYEGIVEITGFTWLGFGFAGRFDESEIRWGEKF